MKNKYLWVGTIAGITVLLDQISKYLVIKYIPRYSTIKIIPGFFDLTHVRNKGAAFGILAGAQGTWRSVFFIVVTLVALAVIAFLIKRAQERPSLIAFSLIGGGAVGNLIDRLRFGEVVDFIEWYYRSYHWPTFNIADTAISVGVGLLAIEMLFSKPQKHVESQ